MERCEASGNVCAWSSVYECGWAKDVDAQCGSFLHGQRNGEFARRRDAGDTFSPGDESGRLMSQTPTCFQFSSQGEERTAMVLFGDRIELVDDP